LFDGLNAQVAGGLGSVKLRLGLGNTANVKWFSGFDE